MKPIEQADAQEMLRILREAWSGYMVPMSWGEALHAVLRKYPDEPAIRSCPCCGGKAGINEVPSEKEVTIWCTDGCGIEMRLHQPRLVAIAAWNKRTP